MRYRYVWVWVAALLAIGCHKSMTAPSAGVVHTYYVAADEVDWNYAPSGLDKMMGMPFMPAGDEKIHTERGPHRIGTVYRKALYREYTDETFTKLRPRPADEAYLGAVGPVLRGEVGDTIRVVFKNQATHPYSMHPHGVFYNKDSEGAGYADGTSGADKEDDAVPPGRRMCTRGNCGSGRGQGRTMGVRWCGSITRTRMSRRMSRAG